MVHINFYRKYRPSFFHELVGQDAIVSILKHVVMQKKLHHAYLFSGMQGIGKTSTARILARAANCLKNQDGDLCGKCAICQKNTNFLQDILEIDAASHNGVDQIRHLREQTMVMPSVSQYRVFIIDEVHMLSKSAFNAFLKILEEPPKHVLFILATTEINKIPSTILSRCQRFHFQQIASDDLVPFLNKIAEKELLVFEKDALVAIADYANGCVRDALNALEQVAFSNLGHKVNREQVIRYFGFLDQTTQNNFLTTLLQQDAKNVLYMIQGFAKSGINFAYLSTQMLESLKNQLFIKLSETQDVSSKKSITKGISIEQLQKISDLIFTTLSYFRYHAKPQLIFEMMCLHILNLLQSNDKTKSLETFIDFNHQLCKIAVADLLMVLKNKDIKLFNLLKLRWKALDQYAQEPQFKSFVTLLNDVHLITCSIDTILIKTNNEKKRNQINNLENNIAWNDFIKELFSQKYKIWAVTNDELYNLKLSYQKYLSD